MRYAVCWTVAVLSAFAINAAHAHDTWLLPVRSTSDAAKTTAFALTSGMDFPNNDYAIVATRIAKSGCRIDAGKCTLAIGKRGAHALALQADVAPSTPAVAWLDLAAKTLDLDDAHVEEYLAEIDAAPSIRATWMALPAPRHWRETYVKHAKSLTGSATDAVSAWSTPVGSELEIIPSSDSRLARDSDATFRVIAHGTPLADFPVGVVVGGSGKPIIARTDSNGDVKIRLDRAGYWMLRVTEIKPAATPGIDWASHFATLTFEVR